MPFATSAGRARSRSTTARSTAPSSGAAGTAADTMSEQAIDSIGLTRRPRSVCGCSPRSRSGRSDRDRRGRRPGRLMRTLIVGFGNVLRATMARDAQRARPAGSPVQSGASRRREPRFSGTRGSELPELGRSRRPGSGLSAGRVVIVVLSGPRDHCGRARREHAR